MGVSALLDVLDEERGVVLRKTLHKSSQYQLVFVYPAQPTVTHLIISSILHRNDLLQALDLRRLRGRRPLDAVPRHERRDRAPELLRRRDGRERRALELPVALLEHRKGREEPRERRQSLRLVQRRTRRRVELRAGGPQHGVPGKGDHGCWIRDQFDSRDRSRL